MSNDAFNTYEYWRIAQSLFGYDSIFNALWRMGTPKFTDKVEKAAVSYSPATRKVSFWFNPGYWNSLDDENKAFLICHEAMHLALNHCVRFGTESKDKKKQDRANAAMDIVVNHMLVNYFGFDRDTLQDWKKTCWIDTMFPQHNPDIPQSERDEAMEKYGPIEEDQNVEYYIQRLLDQDIDPEGKDLMDAHTPMVMPGSGKPGEGEEGDEEGQGDGEGHPDDNSFKGELPGPEAKAEMEAKMRELSEQIQEMQNDDKKKFKSKCTKAGTGVGTWFDLIIPRFTIKRKWERLVKLWEEKHGEERREQWTKLNPQLLHLRNQCLDIPHEIVVEESPRGKKEVWFFIDKSGSCFDQTERFIEAARSLDPAKFNVVLHSFDTAVQPVDLKNGKIHGGGGTSFVCIQNYVMKAKRYPKAIFVATDGYGDHVQIPEELQNRWHWFIGGSQTTTELIPKNCNTHELKDFE